MSAPFLVFAGSAVLALAAAFLRRRLMATAIVSAGGTALIALFVLRAPIDAPISLLGINMKFGVAWDILGRSFDLDQGARPAVGFLYLSGAFLFGGAWAVNPNRYLFPAGILSLALVAGSLLIRPFVFAAVFLELSAMVGVLILATTEYPAQRGGLRLLSLYTLAMMAILLSGWMLSIAGVTTATPDLAHQITLLLVMGFAILMAVPPFHMWLPTAAEETNPYALSFVTVILQSAGLFFLLRFLDTYAWLRLSEGLFSGLRIAGEAMVVFGGLAALSQRSFSKFMAYALVADFGVALLAVGAGTPAGYELALGLSAVRVFGLGVWALGLSVIRGQTGRDDLDVLAGAGYRLPLASAASIVGVLSIAGLPLTAGFPARWALLSAIAPDHVVAAAAVVLSIVITSAGALRWVGVLFRAVPFPGAGLPRRSVQLLQGAGVGLCLLFGVFPQVLFPWVVLAASGLANLMS
jgi:formate hydrogenlyase subunit 3/multisubunit Na+/H+ antiporter MnhD subunit